MLADIHIAHCFIAATNLYVIGIIRIAIKIINVFFDKFIGVIKTLKRVEKKSLLHKKVPFYISYA